jgi:nucleoside-diphosphate-sugar epimerase
MRVFVAGSTGAIGRRLVPILVAEGHDVTGLAHTQAKANSVEAMGATAVVADALNPEALTEAVRRSEPEVIVHELTALSSITGNFRKFDEEFALTNRFRTEVTDTLLSAAREIGTRRFIAQSFCGWPFARVGGPVKSEEDPLDPDPPASFRETLAAIEHLEQVVCQAQDQEAIALRYGFFYGAGTSIADDGSIVEMVRKRRLPIIGDGGGVWSFLHIQDAARATAAAVTRGEPGLYNVVDDEPAPVSTWLPVLAEAVGAKPPYRVPAWVARFAVGDGGVSMMTQIRGASNAKAKRDLGWQPLYASWRRGFVEGLGA